MFLQFDHHFNNMSCLFLLINYEEIESFERERKKSSNVNHAIAKANAHTLGISNELKPTQGNQHAILGLTIR